MPSAILWWIKIFITEPVSRSCSCTHWIMASGNCTSSDRIARNYNKLTKLPEATFSRLDSSHVRLRAPSHQVFLTDRQSCWGRNVDFSPASWLLTSSDRLPSFGDVIPHFGDVTTHVVMGLFSRKSPLRMKHYRTIGAFRTFLFSHRCFPVVFIARCYAERGNAMASRLSVCLSVRLWRWDTMIT